MMIRMLALLGFFAVVVACLTPQAMSYQSSSTGAIAVASGLAKQVSTQEWLGPLAAVALSPFFGLACLTGAATYGPDWLQSRSALFSPGSSLNNPLLFWIMVGLTISTSIPRLTKVSKPFALAAEKLEMYSTIIILMSLKYLGTAEGGGTPSLALEGTPLVVAGIATLPLDVMLSVCAALNIIVINTIKLAIEILVWIIPIPTIDAILEASNKSLCVGLMAIYAYSPMLSTLFNIGLCAVCGLMYFQVKRRMVYTKELLLMPLVERFFGMQRHEGGNCIAFLSSPWNGLPAKTKLQLIRSGDSPDIEVVHANWFRRSTCLGRIELDASKAGLLCDQLAVDIAGARLMLDVRRGTAKTQAAFSLGV